VHVLGSDLARLDQLLDLGELKLRADSWNTRLPCRSPTEARTRPKSAVSAVSMTYCRPLNSRTSLGRLVSTTLPSES
jgi:hypothetical protein